MKYFKIDRDKLLKMLEKSKVVAHREYRVKLKEYKREKIKELEAQIKVLRTGAGETCKCHLYEPSDPTRDYDKMLDLAKLSTDINLNIREDMWRSISALLKHEGEL